MSPNPDEAPRRGETRAVRSRGRLAEEVGMDEKLRGGPLPARPGSPRWFMQHYRGCAPGGASGVWRARE